MVEIKDKERHKEYVPCVSYWSTFNLKKGTFHFFNDAVQRQEFYVTGTLLNLRPFHK